MSNPAMKSHPLSSHYYYKAKRWEGKPLFAKFKYAVANYPELCFGVFVTLVITPLLLTYKSAVYENSKAQALRKFKSEYTVVRDDDPDIKRILQEKELGKQYFNKC